MSIFNAVRSLSSNVLGAKFKEVKADSDARLIIDEYGNLRVNYNNKSVQEGMSKQIKALRRMDARKEAESPAEAG